MKNIFNTVLIIYFKITDKKSAKYKKILEMNFITVKDKYFI